MKIGKKEKFIFWVKCIIINILHGIVGFLGYLPFPLAYYLRHKVGLTGKQNPLWLFLNYTEDSDWGLSHYKDNPPERTFKNALAWYKRNKAWNFVLLFKPNTGEIEDLELYTTVQGREYHIDWPNKDTEKWGKLKAYYRVEGTVYGRYGFAKPTGLIKEFQIGSSGNRYKFRMKFKK